MKILKLLSVVLITGTCAVGAQAQKLKYLPQVLKETPKVSYVLKSSLPYSARTNISATVNRAVAAHMLAQTAATSTTVAPKQTKDTYYPRNFMYRWLGDIESWVLEHKRWPSGSVEEERAMYQSAHYAIRNYPQIPVVARLAELKKQFGREYSADKTPEEWLAIVEPWVLEHQAWPSSNIEQEKAMYAGAYRAIRYHPEDWASIRLQELYRQFGKTKTAGDTPDGWLDIIEPWVLENKRWPSASVEGEKEMYQGAYRAMYNHPKDPASLRLKELKEKIEEREDQTQADPVINASKAATLVEGQVAFPGNVATDEYIDQLMRFYNHLDPFGTGNIQ